MKGTQKVNLGSTVDELYELRTKRIQLQKEVDALKAQETQLQNSIVEELNAQGLAGAKGQIGTVSLNPTTVPTVVNWSELEGYIQQTGHFHLMQRRMSGRAYIEHLEQLGQVPGVEPTTLTKLSLTRSSK